MINAVKSLSPLKKAFIFVLFDILFVWVLLSAYSAQRYSAYDARALSDITEIQRMLDLYYDASQSYPPIGEYCANIDVLLPFFPNSVDNFNFITTNSLPPTPMEKLLGRPVYSVGISVSDNGGQYIIRIAGLRDQKTGGVSGALLGCSCGDGDYCAVSN
jgi:type II secretory pathway pseudopilin PulG